MQIQLNNRFIDDNGSRCKLSVDGTDFMVYEPRPFDWKWYSEKFHGAGLRYEIGVCIQTGWICWVNGPFPCGSWPDIQISQDSLVYELLPDKFVLADRGYGGAYHLTPNNTGHNNRLEKKMMGAARARHESINRLFKVYGCLKQKWRHQLTKHHNTFWAIANITQLKITKERANWKVKYQVKW